MLQNYSGIYAKKSYNTGNSYQEKVNRQERNYTEEQFNNIASSFNDIDDLEL